MKRRFACLLCAASLALCALASSAHAEERRRTLIGTGRIWGSLQTELVTVDDAFHGFFFKNHTQQYTLETGVRVWDNFDLLGSLGYRFEQGHQLNEADVLSATFPVRRLTNEDTLHTIPMTASLRYRLQWDPEFWLVPYVRGGVTGAWFIYDEDTLGVKKVWGVKWGLNGGAGVLWRIDGLDRTSRRSLQAQGIDAMYLDTGFHWQWVDDFGGRGLDYSGIGARLGITLWIR